MSTFTPLPKYTINGLDGFLSGKWTFANAYSVIDDVTVSGTPTGQYQQGSIAGATSYPVIPGQTYTLSATQVDGNGAFIGLAWLDSSRTQIGNANASSNSPSVTGTVPSGISYVSVVFSNRATSGWTQCTFKNLMLNLGSIPAPYEKKRGDRMVVPVPKKNLYALGDNTVTNNIPNNSNYTGSAGLCTISQGLVNGAPYTLSGYFTNFSDDGTTNWRTTMSIYYADGTFDAFNNGINSLPKDGVERFVSITGTADPSKILSYIKLYMFDYSAGSPVHRSFRNLQLEQGSVATPYSPYAVQVNPKPSRAEGASKGLSFNGTTDNVVLNSVSRGFVGDLTIEVDFMLRDVTKASATLIGNDTFGLRYDGTSTSFNLVKYALADQRVLYAISPNVRYKVKAIMHATYTEYFINGTSIGIINNSMVVPTSSTPIAIGSDKRTATGYGNFVNGVIYTVHMYDSTGDIVNYDFTNPCNFVGSQFIPNAQNLIPSFDNPGWTIHSNAKVLGKDVLHLDATSSGQSSVGPKIPVSTSNKYYYAGSSNGTVWMDCWDSNGSKLFTYTINGQALSFNSLPANSVNVSFSLGSLSSGSFDFVRPQMFQLTGQEGTINGTPIQLNNAVKRNLYTKR